MKNKITRLLFMVSRFGLYGLLVQAIVMQIAIAHPTDAQAIKSVKEYSAEFYFENSGIREILSDIESKSDFRFVFYQNDIESKVKFNLDKQNITVADLLLQLSENYHIAFKQVNNTITIRPLNAKKSQDGAKLEVIIQGRTITGRVLTSEDNSGLPGVNVLVKGTSQGTVTDLEGNYVLEVQNDQSILVFSSVGYVTQEIVVGGQTILDMVMNPDIKALEEIVVTALGIKREQKALGYAVQEVKGDNLQKVQGIDVATSLTGKVAGVLVQNSTDFNVEPNIQVRGETPLIVIDGIAYSNKKLNDISAEDIESITVLKGPTASALYGFRGKSGVIVITTKNGNGHDLGVSVNVSSNTMFNAGYLAIPEKQSIYGRGTAYLYDITSDQSWGTFMDGSIQRQWDPIAKEYRDYEYLPVGKDNFNNFLEPGYITNNNVNVAFKTDKSALRSSINWTENKGRYPNSLLDKFTYTLGGDIQTDKFKLSSNVSYARRYSPNMGSNGYTSYDPMYTLLIWSSADFDILDYKDNYWLKPDELQNNHFGYDLENNSYTGKNQNNPYFDRYERTNEVSRDIFNADVTLGYDITDWLNVTARTGIDFFTDQGQLRISQGSYTSSGNTGIPGNPSTWNGTRTGAYLTGQTQGLSINSDFLLGGNKKFNKLNLEYLAGGTIFYDKSDNMNAKTVGGISIPGYFSLNASVNPATVAESTVARQVNSLFGRVAVSWDEMIYLDFTGRQDWVSMLANPQVPKSDRSYFYPSVSGSFVVSEILPESVNNWLDLLKLRASWTQAKSAPSPYAINSVFTVYPGTWNALNGAGAPESLYLNTYSPDSYATTEVGLQSIVFNRLLTLDLTYYNKLYYDILRNGPLTSASGYTGFYLNTNEEYARKGWEVALTATPIRNNNLQWDLGFNWSTHKEVYVKLDSLYTPNFGKEWVEVGNRTDPFTLNDYLRVPDGEYAGQNIYNTSGRIMRSSYPSLYGYSAPDWIWGVNTTLRYKNFSLYMSFDGVVGGLLSSRTESYMWQSGVHPNSLTPERELDALDPVSRNYIGQGVGVVSGEVTYDPNGNILTDTREYAPNEVATTYKQAVQDLHSTSAWGGSGNPNDVYARTFLKLRELSLTYTVPNQFLGNFGGGFIKNASVGFVGQNVLFWSKDWKYSDPDGGNEDFADPSVRYLGFNVKLSF
jgi:TonB-linked SusC/RagA family outer membrane protein